MRATFDGRAASFVARHHPLEVTELRLIPTLAVALGRDVLVSAEAPVLHRARRGYLSAESDKASGPVGNAEDTRWMMGDVEARVSYVASRSLSRRLSFIGGVKAPTAPIERGTPTDLQPGCGAIVPTIGATYTWIGELFSAWLTASFLMPVSVRSGPHPGDSLRAGATVQLQPTSVFAARLGAHGRLDAAGSIDDAIDPRSGGASVFVTPEIVTSPTKDLVVGVGAAFPIVQEMRGHRLSTPVALASIGYDF